MKYYFRIIKNNLLIISLFIILNKILFCQINDNFQSGTLETGGNSILDVADYLNLSILASSSGTIYNASPLSAKISISAPLNASSSIAVCNGNFILAACLTDSLLVKINLNNGNYENLLAYSDFGTLEVSSTSSCSLSIYENIVLIGISQPVNYNKIKNGVIKVTIKNKDDINNGPLIDDSFEKELFNFPVEHTKTSTTRDISCEIIVEKTSNNYRFICVYENIDSTDKIVTIVTINNSMDNFEKTIYPINPVPYEYGFRLYKIDNYYIRLVTRTDVYDLYLDENFDIKYKSINQKFNG